MLSTTDILTIGIGAAALVVALVAAFFAYKAIPPKRALSLTVSDTRLLNATSTIAGQLKVSHTVHGQLTDPRLVRITVRNAGRAAVTSDMYDGGKPLRIGLGAQVIEKLEDESSIPGVSKPSAVLNTALKSLEIGPGAIHRDQELIYEVLVDGQVSVEEESPLIDVRLMRVAEAAAEASAVVGQIATARLAGAASGAAALVTAVAALLTQ